MSTLEPLLETSDHEQLEENFEDAEESGGIFKTEVDFSDKKDSKASKNVNIIALRETFLSVAPFVKPTNRLFWRKWIDTKEYVSMLTSSVNFLETCLSEGGILDVDKLNDIKDSEFIFVMANSLADMFLLQTPRDRELFFNRLPELLCFMIINALQTSMHRYSRLFMSAQFREILLDWTCEVISGIRNSDIRRNREWLFLNALDMPIATKRSYNKESRSEDVYKQRSQGDMTTLASARSTFVFGHSPLINNYLCKRINADSNSASLEVYPCTNSLRMTLCHIPDRPINGINEESTLKLVRKKIITEKETQHAYKEGFKIQKKLSRKTNKLRSDFDKDISSLKSSIRTTLKSLDDRNETEKKELMASVKALTRNNAFLHSKYAEYGLATVPSKKDLPSKPESVNDRWNEMVSAGKSSSGNDGVSSNTGSLPSRSTSQPAGLSHLNSACNSAQNSRTNTASQSCLPSGNG